MCYKFVLPETGRAVQLSRSKRERIIADLLYLVPLGVGRFGGEPWVLSTANSEMEPYFANAWGSVDEGRASTAPKEAINGPSR